MIVILECLKDIIIQNIIVQIITKDKEKKQEAEKTVIVTASIGIIILFFANLM